MRTENTEEQKYDSDAFRGQKSKQPCAAMKGC